MRFDVGVECVRNLKQRELIMPLSSRLDDGPPDERLHLASILTENC